MGCSFRIKGRYANINVFQKNLHESGHKANKIWLNKGSKFYNRSAI